MSEYAKRLEKIESLKAKERQEATQFGNSTGVQNFAPPQYDGKVRDIYCDKHRKPELMGTKKIICVDCGAEVEVDAKDNSTKRCDNCYKTYRRNYYRENKKKNRKLQKMSTAQLIS